MIFLLHVQSDHSVGEWFRAQLWDEDNPTEPFRGMVTEEVALTGTFAPGCHERYQLLERFLYLELGGS